MKMYIMYICILKIFDMAVSTLDITSPQEVGFYLAHYALYTSYFFWIPVTAHLSRTSQSSVVGKCRVVLTQSAGRKAICRQVSLVLGPWTTSGCHSNWSAVFVKWIVVARCVRDRDHFPDWDQVLLSVSGETISSHQLICRILSVWSNRIP